VFGITRFVSYLLWVRAAETAVNSLREVVTPTFDSAGALAILLAGFVVLIALVRLDWARLIRRWLPTVGSSETSAQRAAATQVPESDSDPDQKLSRDCHAPADRFPTSKRDSRTPVGGSDRLPDAATRGGRHAARARCRPSHH
jgi:hypothetical protein